MTAFSSKSDTDIYNFLTLYTSMSWLFNTGEEGILNS